VLSRVRRAASGWAAPRGGSVHLFQQLVSAFMSRPKAHLALAFFVVSNHLSVVALAAVPPANLILGQAANQVATVCAADLDAVPDTQVGCGHTTPADDARVSVP